MDRFIAPLIPPPLAQAVELDSVWEVVSATGPIGLAIVGLLLLVSIATVALVAEQLMTLRASRLAPEGLAGRLRKTLATGDLSAALGHCHATPSFLSSVVSAGIAELAGRSLTPDQSRAAWTDAEKAMEDTAEAETARLHRRVDYLAVIGNLAPMLGLLGTVVGMIVAFRQVAVTEGAASAGELASGIYQALVTTVGGLIVAIPALAAYAVLRNRVDRLAEETVAEATRATAPLKQALLGPPAAPVRATVRPVSAPSVFAEPPATPAREA
ncbi:MotA/TolQ/ExbB proton channel family protein [Botrimarina hoheduenensis]|uniref:Biopolymer transport protein ExbB n=1 Tax=Botrimarina hoheduenensis TaxID=2528000 RepID=A0A5C5W8X4_9BACT|nr:MotA/TolQ/ExbB proton channel family protein [Botrimarina hoheduenensis]TWT46471.1 Biopolymer transport protein ExbB [Botrimarina hoheduenensis]